MNTLVQLMIVDLGMAQLVSTAGLFMLTCAVADWVEDNKR